MTPPSSQPPNQLSGDLLADLIGEELPTEIYMRFLGVRHLTRRTLIDAGYSTTASDAALTILESRGLIAPQGKGAWSVVPPAQSFPHLAAQLESRAATLRAALPGVVASYHRIRADQAVNAEEAGIERLADVEEVVAAMVQCLTRTRRSGRAMRRGDFTTRSAVMDLLPPTMKGEIGASGRRVSMKTVLHESLVRTLDTADAERLLSVPTETVRLAQGVPFTALVNDDGMAVVELNDAGHISGLLLTNPVIVEALGRLVDLMWRLGAPWYKLAGAPGDRPGDDQERIVSMLAAGLPDAAIARQLGISSRTLDRRMREIMDSLNASSRFQAGVLAAQRGWV